MRKPMDLQVRFRKHVGCMVKWRAAAERSLALKEAGKIEEARKAFKEAERWEFECRKLEPSKLPQRGRTSPANH